MKRLHAVIQGIVQGVFFRRHTILKANELGVTGWVRNKSDGSVEVVAEGDEMRLKDFLEWLHKGPSAARVDKVDYEWLEYTGEFNSFGVY